GGGGETLRGGDVGGFKQPLGESDVNKALEIEALVDAMDVDNGG
ncbi:hypothetical protein Tco_1422927, partial [Tanacetum coccineum]